MFRIRLILLGWYVTATAFSVAVADDIAWNDTNGGAFEDASNWNPTMVPDADDNAIYNRSGSYTIAFTADHSNNAAISRRGTVTLDLNDFTYSLTSTSSSPRSLLVGAEEDDFSPELRVTDGTLVTQVSIVGGQGEDGDVVITTDGVWNLNNTMFLGSSGGTGEVTVTSGGVINSRFTVIGSGGSDDFGRGFGEATVSGSGSLWSASDQLTIGQQNRSDGLLTVNSGGSVSVASIATIGSSSDATGSVVITGNNSTFTAESFLNVGGSGAGSLLISNGGTVRSATAQGESRFGNSSSGNGSVTVRNPNSLWEANHLRIGSQGAGTLSIESGGAVQSSSAQIGDEFGSQGSVTITGTGSTWTASSFFTVGEDGDGTLTIDTGGQLITDSDGEIGAGEGAGSVVVAGNNAAWVGNDDIFVGGHASGAGLASGTLTVATGGTVSTASFRRLKVWGPGTVNLRGGTINAGTLDIAGGAFNFESGTLNITGSTFDVSATGPFGSTLVLDAGKRITAQNVTVDTDALLLVEGGQLEAGSTFTNLGEALLSHPLARLGGSSVTNSGLLHGTGRVTGTLANQTSGKVRASGTDRLVFSGAAAENTNDGRFALLGGTIEFAESLTNNTGGRIAGRGVLATGGLTNDGLVAFSGGFSDVFGEVANNASGEVLVAGQATATFYDAVTNDGDFQTEEGSSSVFLGDVTGIGAFLGEGTAILEAGLAPNDTAVLSFGGDVRFGDDAHLEIQIGGLAPGTQHDQVTAAGAVALAGALDVSLIAPFAPQAGNTFEIISAQGGINGAFSTTTNELPDLGEDLSWAINYGTNNVVLAVLLAGLVGDYNNDGSVNVGDYTTWRDNLGAPAGTLPNDIDGGVIGQAQYATWKATFEMVAGSAAARGTAVPEPTSALLVLGLAIAGVSCRYRFSR